MPEIRRDVETFVLGQVTYHAMSKCEVAEGGLTPEEKDGSVSPTKQGVPGGGGRGGKVLSPMFIDKSLNSCTWVSSGTCVVWREESRQ